MIYLVLSSLCLALLYGVYRLALSRTTLHRFNRILLLSIIGLSAILPAIRISGIGAIDATGAIGDSPLLHVREEPAIDAIGDAIGDSPQLPAEWKEEATEYTPAEEVLVPVQRADVKTSVATGVKVAETVTQLDWVSIITYLYLIGVGFFMIRLLIGITRAETLCRLGGRELKDGSKLLVCDGEFQPTSWRRTVIMSRRDFESAEKDIIIEHELTHIHCHHSIDVVIAQITCALQWFNPAAWALKRSLQEVHEYEADANVLADGENERRYQICLVQAALGNRIGYVTSNFADCSTKKRIKMMKRSQSSPFACLRALLMLPVVLITILLASACKPKATQDSSAAAQSESVVESVPTVVAQSVTQNAPFDTAAFLFKYPVTQTVYTNDLFVTVEKDGSIWISAGVYSECLQTTLTDFEKDLERFKSNSKVKFHNPDVVYLRCDNRKDIGVCVKLTELLSKTYSEENIRVIVSRRLPMMAPSPRWGYNMDTANGRCIQVNVSADDQITFTAWNAAGNQKKVEKKVGSAEELKTELDKLFPKGAGKVMYGVSADIKSTERVGGQVLALLRNEGFTQAPFNEGPANMSRQDSIDYIILGKEGGDSGRKRHIKNMQWYNENKDKDEFFRMGFVNGQLSVCKGNDASKLAPLAFDDLVPYFKANCPDGNERSAIVLLELPMDDETVSVEFLDKLLTKMEGWITTFTKRLYLSPVHIE